MVVTFQNRGISSPCHNDMRACVAAGDDIVWVGFPPGGNDKYVILTKSGKIYKNGLPTGCENDMNFLIGRGAKLIRVVFTPSGGWCVVDNTGGRMYNSIPQRCIDDIKLLSEDSVVTHVSFSPDGGWVVINALGVTATGGLTSDCNQKINDLKAGGAAKITSVTFPLEGGNTWCVINNTGSFYLASNQGEETLMYMRYFNQVYGPNRHVFFDTDGNGWSVLAEITKHETFWDGTNNVSILEVYQNVAARLEDSCTGYAVTVARSSMGSYSHGLARTSADGTPRGMMPWTKLQVASVGKFITALTAIRQLQNSGINLTSAIGPRLPHLWKVDPSIQNITFAQLLSHTSGLLLGDGPQEYKDYKTMFEQTVVAGKPSTTYDPRLPKTYAYSNYNFGIFRIMLPMLVGVADDDPDALGKSFIKLVQKWVFDPVGVKGVDVKPPTTGSQAYEYGLSYQFPGNGSGYDWGDWTLKAGEAGFWVSVDDMAAVLNSLNKDDGRILSTTTTPKQLADMEKNSYGLDNTSSSGYRWLEKKGGMSSSNRVISTTVQILGPAQGVFAALFVNSDISTIPLQGSWLQCTKCQGLVFTGGSTSVPCPGGGFHSTNINNGNYGLAQGTNVINNKWYQSQMGWRYCNKCHALHYAGITLGSCPAGGVHAGSPSGDYGIPIRQRGIRELREYTVGWRRCTKCQVLTFPTTPVGKCGAGGVHDSVDTTNYVVPNNNPLAARHILWDAYANALTL